MARKYDVAIDLQGLLKSATASWLSGARRVIGFETSALRERGAAWFYSETARASGATHVIEKNRSVLPLIGVRPGPVSFPFRVPASVVATRLAAQAPDGYVLLNPGAAWPNKRWDPTRFGAVAARIRDRYALPSFVLWGRGESSLADRVVAASEGAAIRAPETTLGDLLAAAKGAALMLSGDTGPVHLAAAMATPIVGLYGPTWPERNGPWDAADEVVSRADHVRVPSQARVSDRTGCASTISRLTKCSQPSSGGSRKLAVRDETHAARRVLEALARRRVTLGFVCGALVLWLAQPTWRALVIGACVAACGEATRLWAAGHLEKSREVTRSGPYRWTRHPLYLGSSVLALGVAIASASLVVAVIIAIYVGATIPAAMVAEERHLREKFGGEYDAYADRRAYAHGAGLQPDPRASEPRTSHRRRRRHRLRAARAEAAADPVTPSVPSVASRGASRPATASTPTPRTRSRRRS